jgi:DNA-directed RNA polymerase subunit RPC12/RpoP
VYCSNCGKKLSDDAKFCDGCGAKVIADTPAINKIEKEIKDGKVFKCPYCGEILPYDAVRCSSCGNEIRGREANKTVQSFFDKLEKIDDIDKKIELIKGYPISNTREDIFEFMLLASASFDAKYYATNKRKDNVASAWLAKIDSCYEKAKIMFDDKKDLAQIELIYQKVHKDSKEALRLKWILIIGGAVLITAGLVIVSAFSKDNTAIGAIGLVLLAGGILGLIFGLRRKKTNKEIEQEKIEKEKKKNNK